MKKTITGCLLLICLMGISVKLEAASKSRQYRFWIEFTDKKFSNYSLLKPWDFLSQRALDRRNRVGYTVNMQDIPVTKRYVDTIAIKGVRVLLISRWMNAVLVSSPDSVLSADITSQYFVRKTSLVGIYNLKRGFAEERPGAALDYSMLLGNEEEKISVKNNV
ncbi:MAG: hypothetical protein IT244_02550, partial [Bacteroidia bacterium]|nr:hypothetical protein [Bacteroidia bacterium]